MKMNLVFGALTSLLLVSCASKKDAKYEEREFEKTYKVSDASRSAIPEWIDDPSLEVKDDSRYFVSDSQNKNQRLCLKSAEVRATAKIASEISQFIKNTYGESTQGGDAVVEEYMEESLAQEAQAFVIGAQVKKSYWERRQYSKDRGAEEDLLVYQCYVLVKMSEKNLDRAIKNATAKLYTSISNPEVKQKTQKILEDVSQKFKDQYQVESQAE